jgi:alkylhydroperoxidase/carboxymuconolactone decarboxylase family protein YurZ
MLPEQAQTFADFQNSALHNEVFDSKTTILFHLAAAMAVGCSPWMEHYLGVTRKEGISDEEIGTVQSIVMSLASCRVRSQVKEVQEKIKQKSEDSS